MVVSLRLSLAVGKQQLAIIALCQLPVADCQLIFSVRNKLTRH